MNLVKVAELENNSNKVLNIFEDSNKRKFIEKLAPIEQYETLRKIAEISIENENLSEICALYFDRDNKKIVKYLEPFYEGKTLEALIIEKHQFSKTELNNIIYQICLALKSLHEADILHKDIKPANIILGNNNNIIVLDYDISTFLTYDGNLKHAGTKGYASPEQYGFLPISFPSDIYSLGITISKLVENCSENLHFDFEHIITKASELDPRNRYQTIDEIIDIITRNDRIFLPHQQEQIEKGIQLGLTQSEVSVYAKPTYNAKQMGVIKHAFAEKINPKVIEIMLESNFNSRQMYQIKRGSIDNLTIPQIKKYSKHYFSSDDMAIYRNGLVYEISENKILENIKYYNILLKTKIFDDEQLKVIRFSFFSGLVVKDVQILAHEHLDYSTMKKILQILLEKNEKTTDFNISSK